MFGVSYNRKATVVAWFPLFVGFNVLYLAMMVLGVEGMPRRYFDHLPRFHTGHLVATVGSWILVVGILILFGSLLVALRKGKKAEANPWGGITLDWQISSPPPPENFDQIPTITGPPYAFNPERTA